MRSVEVKEEEPGVFVFCLSESFKSFRIFGPHFGHATDRRQPLDEPSRDPDSPRTDTRGSSGPPSGSRRREGLKSDDTSRGLAHRVEILWSCVVCVCV